MMPLYLVSGRSKPPSMLLILALLSCCAFTHEQWQKDVLEDVKCPQVAETSTSCTCGAATDGLDFKCSGDSPRTSLNDVTTIIGAARFMVKTFTVANLDSNLTQLPPKLFANGSVAELTIDNSNIKDVDDNAFEGGTLRLQSLILKNSRLTTVPRAVAKVSSLRRLDLRSNSIAEVLAYTFFGASKLSQLDLRDNKLTNMAENAFLGLENNLRELILRGNNFQIFPMSAVKILKKLQILDLADNSIGQITYESFTKMDSIKHIDLSSNNFGRLDRGAFSTFPRLQQLLLKSNQIGDIAIGSLDGLHDLEVIDLSQNNIRKLPESIFTQTRRLTKVYLSHNKLQSLSGIFVDLYSLEEIYLNDNLLFSITDDWFKNAPNLRIIHLENNVVFDIEDNALQPLKRLSHIYLSNNFLNEVKNSMFRYNVALTVLNLDHNHISTIESNSFRGIPKLKELRLQNNNLRRISREHFVSLTSLIELYLQNNRIAEIDSQAFSGLAQLQFLDMRNNRLPKLEDIMMRYPSTLSALYLEDNRLVSFHRETFSGQTTVEILSMANNRLERIPVNVFNELINLFRLSLANNRIQIVDDNAFIGLHQVRFIDLRNNRLVKLTNGTLRGLQQAEMVNLSGNKIASIQSEAFTGFHHLKELDLSYNKLKMIKNGAFRGCLTLHTLKLKNAGISLIQPNAFDDFVNLKFLDLSDNKLTIPDALFRLGTSPSLITLILSGNDLSNITTGSRYFSSRNLTLFTTFATLPNIESIELEGCNLGNISADLFADNTKLTTIKLGDNNLTKLGRGVFSKQVFLRELHLDANRFVEPPTDALLYLFNLVKLNLSNNLIAELTESAFDHVGNVEVLDLSNNNMEIISERSFHNITKLTSLNLQSNLFKNFPTRTLLPLVDLRELHVSDNQLQHIPVAVQGLRKATFLNLSENPMERLKEIPGSRAMMLTVENVILTYTNLSIIGPGDLDLFPNVTELDLSHNCLSRIAPYAFAILSKLHKLDLSHNEIMHLSRERLVGLTNLKMLNLSVNHIGSLDAFPTDLKNLVILDISNNRLRSIARDSMNALENLVRLDLRGNLLTELMPEVLFPLKKVRAVDLANNQFSNLPLEGIASVEDTLEELNLEGNPLVCSCSSYNQKLWLRQHRKWLDAERRGSKIGPQCQEPTPLINRYLLTVKDSELCPLPSVSSLQLSQITPNSFLVTWDSPDTNLTGLKGFIVAYHRLDKNDQVKKYRVSASTRGFFINELMDNTLYLVCVVTRGSSYTRSPNEKDGNSKNKVIASNDDDFYTDSDEDVISANRKKRETQEDEEESVVSNDDESKFMSLIMELVQESNDTSPEREMPIVYPGSNDTTLLLLRPTIVNLGSQSSKCTEVKTPQDPEKISLIDNKRMSIIIGVVGGLVVFAGIILIIVSKPNSKDDDEPIDESLAIGGANCPKDSNLIFTGAAISSRFATGNHSGLDRQPKPPSHAEQVSRANSVTSHKATALGADAIMANERLKKSKSNKDRGEGNLRKNRTIIGEEGSQHSLLPKQHSYSSGERSGNGRNLMSKQSSTESRPSSSNRLSHQSSSETTLPVSGKRRSSKTAEWQKDQGADGGQSWHGTPRADPRRTAMAQSSHSTSLPRHFQAQPGSQAYSKADPGGNSRIPLIEYHLLERNSDTVGDAEVINSVRKGHYSKRHSGEHDDDPHSKLGPDHKSYIKYNSFANY